MKCNVYNHSSDADSPADVAEEQNALIELAPRPGPHKTEQAGEKSAQQHPGANRGRSALQKTRQRSDLGDGHAAMLTGSGAHVVR